MGHSSEANPIKHGVQGHVRTLRSLYCVPHFT